MGGLTVVDILFPVIGGIAAHQSDRFISRFPLPWRQFCRYVIGVLTVFVFFSVSLRRLNQAAQRDGTLAFLLSAVGVGAGVVVGHFVDVLGIRE